MPVCQRKNALHPIATTLAVLFLVTATAQAQMAPPGPEMDVLKKDVGEWDCVIKAWAEPGAAPTITKGTESSRMFGGYWLITDFKGNLFGNDFEGHGTYGFDTKKKKYIGTWIDSLGPFMMQTEGTYDEKTETLTAIGDSPGPDGVTMFTYTMATTYKGEKRVMTMHMQPKGSSDDQKMQLLEITSTKKAKK